MSKSTETTVAQNINATLTVEDIPMNENVTLAQLNEAVETKEKKEKKSVSKFMAEENALIDSAFDFEKKLKVLNAKKAILVEYGQSTEKIDAEIAALSPDLSDEDYIRIGKKYALYRLDK